MVQFQKRPRVRQKRPRVRQKRPTEIEAEPYAYGMGLGFRMQGMQGFWFRVSGSRRDTHWFRLQGVCLNYSVLYVPLEKEENMGLGYGFRMQGVCLSV